MLVGEESGNNEVGETDPSLLRTLLQASEKEKKIVNQYIFSPEDIQKALDIELDLIEENCLEYLTGYFFKRLLSFHGSECFKCLQNAFKFTKQSETNFVSDIFFVFQKI